MRTKKKTLFIGTLIAVFAILFISCAGTVARGEYDCGFELCPTCNHACYYNTHSVQHMGIAVYEKWQCQYCNSIRWILISRDF
jgi:hypothetical protein